jgi:predicted amidohydrolase
MALSSMSVGTTEDQGAAITRRMVNKARVAVCQILCIDGDAEGNYRRVEYAVEEAARQRAVLACFPESAILGWINPDAHNLADPIPGAITGRLAALARRYKLMICIGMDEKDGDKLFDSAVLIGAHGELLLKHRKINNLSHEKLMEPSYTDGKPEDIQVVETPIGRIGILICADTFVENYVRGIGEKKPDLLLAPYGWAEDIKAWPEHGQKLERTVSRAATWAGCPVVGTDCVGMITHGPWKGRTYGGQSVVADRDGKILGVLRDRDVEVRVFEIDPGRGR